MKILVTGGAGFIGSHLADAFLDDGHEVAVVDNLSTGREENVPARCEFHRADIRDADAMRSIFEAFRPDVLCHQAAQADVRISVANPAADAETNVLGSLNLFEACRHAGTRRVLFASTGGAIYGEQSRFPADEQHPTRPASPYGAAKLAVEAYLGFYALEYGLEATALRYANVYGPRQNPHGEAGVVAIFANKIRAGESPVIYGDGEQTRDFVFVGDVVRANHLALDRRLLGAFNVGTGVETSVNEICESLLALSGASVDVKREAGKPGEQRRSCLDTAKIHAATGWRPATMLGDGLAETWRSFADQD